MSIRPKGYEEFVAVTPQESPDFASYDADHVIAGWARVEVSDDGFFVSVITDDYEGRAMMALPVAEKLIAALGRAVEAAKAARATR